MRSLSEIETTSKRATRAAGFSWGIAEEVGKCVRLLELFGFPGIKNLNQYYQDKNEKSFKNLNYISENNVSDLKSYCPISLGVSFLDQVKKLDPLKKISFEKIAYPLLLIPFLSRSSEIIGKKILLKFNKNNFLLNFNINISSNFINDEFPKIAEKVEITFLDNKNSFSETDWKTLYKLSENTYVEETDSLKQGAAGAGLTDND